MLLAPEARYLFNLLWRTWCRREEEAAGEGPLLRCGALLLVGAACCFSCLSHLEPDVGTSQKTTSVNFHFVLAGIGHQPNSGFLNGQLQLDDHGYVQVCSAHSALQSQRSAICATGTRDGNTHAAFRTALAHASFWMYLGSTGAVCRHGALPAGASEPSIQAPKHESSNARRPACR